MAQDIERFGIETVYRGINFRSRLEARWAAFFDQVGWKWDYEPFDLDGYIPDFLITGRRDILVEVRPGRRYDGDEFFLGSGHDLVDEQFRSAMEDLGKAEHLDFDLLALGVSPRICPESIGVMMGEWRVGWTPAHWWDNTLNRVGFASELDLWQCVVWGGPHEKYGCCAPDWLPAKVEAAWANACNATQYRPKKRRR